MDLPKTYKYLNYEVVFAKKWVFRATEIKYEIVINWNWTFFVILIQNLGSF